MACIRLITLILALVLPGGAIAASTDARAVYTVTVDGAIDPATADYIIRGLKEAEEARARAYVIQLDTPGGLNDSMRKIIREMFASEVPVVVYVTPNGARAASAGAFITMAANIAAMAPVSNIGSASPVAISPGGGSEQLDDTMKKKVTNDAAEYAKSIAERRGRNTGWAEKAVRGAANLTSTQALKENVIDYVAEDIRDLLQKIDGDKVKLNGTQIVLDTDKAPVREVPMNARESFLHFLANPNVAAILLMIAIYGIIAELSNPGSIFPGVLGGISLILFLYSFSILPLNATGLALIVFAIILFIAEVKVPGTGVLTFGGILSMGLGLFLLFNTGSPAFRISLHFIAAITVLTAGFFIFVVQTGLRALKKPVVTGREGLVGTIVEAKTDIDGTGKVFTDGSWWTAESDEKIKQGERVEITAIEGLRLKVRKAGP